MSAIRFEPLSSPAADTETQVLRAQRNIEINFLYFDAAGAVDIQFSRGQGTRDNLSGVMTIPAGGVIPAMYLPPGSGIPLPSGELWLSKSAGVQIGGIIGWSLSSVPEAPAIEGPTPAAKSLEDRAEEA